MKPDFANFEEEITKKLRSGLDKRLHYHGWHHVEYVLKAALEIAAGSKLTDHEIILLKTAVLLHDSGFLRTYMEHEIVGTEIAREMLPGYGYNSEDIKTIIGMIMSTRIPQTTTNHLEEIIADADLEYLGTDRFDEISEYLYQELLAYDYIHNRDEWNRIQMRFLSAHHYFTDFCRNNREKVKQQHLTKIKKLIK